MHMMHMIQSRKQLHEKDDRHDLFSSLLGAALDDADSGPNLADSELIGTSI